MRVRHDFLKTDLFTLTVKEGWTHEEVLDVLRQSRGWTCPEFVGGESTGRKLIQTCLKDENSKEDNHIDGATVTIGWMSEVESGHKDVYECENGGIRQTRQS